MNAYQKMIAQVAKKAKVSFPVEMIEEEMRAEEPTLDHLSRQSFDALARRAIRTLLENEAVWRGVDTTRGWGVLRWTPKGTVYLTQHGGAVGWDANPKHAWTGSMEHAARMAASPEFKGSVVQLET